MSINKLLSLSIAALGFFMLSGPALAQDDPAKMLVDAQALYEQRPEKIEEAAAMLTKALVAADDEELRYKIILLHSKVLYWKGEHAETDEQKITIHLEGRALSDKGIGEMDEYAELYYWSSAHLGKWALANGPLASLGQKDTIIATTEMLYETDTQDGELGEDYHWRGADRVLGRLYFKLPGFAGGSLEKSLKYLAIAYEKAPKYVTNINYYAESLYNGTASQKDKAKQILDALLAEDPKNYNPARPQETLEEFEIARDLRNQMGE